MWVVVLQIFAWIGFEFLKSKLACNILRRSDDNVTKYIRRYDKLYCRLPNKLHLEILLRHRDNNFFH